MEGNIMKELKLLINNEEIKIEPKGDVDLYDIFLAIFALVDLGTEAEPKFKEEILKFIKEIK